MSLINKNIFIIAAAIIAVPFIKQLFKLFLKKRTRNNIIKKIKAKIEPASIKEAELYLNVVDSAEKNSHIEGWGRYLLMKYYRSNYDGSRRLLALSIENGEKIRSSYKNRSFYEDALFYLGNIYFFETFDFNKAADVYAQLIEEKPSTRWKGICRDRIRLINENTLFQDALKLYVTAEKSFEESRLEKAEKYLSQVINEYPKTNLAASSLYFLGDINYYKYNNLNKAVQYYRKTVDLFPNTEPARNALYKIGEILRKLKRWDQAVEAYREFIHMYKLSPLKDDAYFFIGECYQNMGKLREAKNSFSLVLGDYPDSKWTEVIYHKVQEINKILKEV